MSQRNTAEVHALAAPPARFVALAAGARLPGPCAALLVACFRADGGLLMVQAAAPHEAWDVPHGPLLPTFTSDPGAAAITLVARLCGVEMATRPLPYGYIQWETAAPDPHLTACMLGEVGRVVPLPAQSWAARRAFLHPHDAIHRLPADGWSSLRRACLEAALSAAASARDFWLIQPLDAISRADLEDVLD